MLNLLFYGYLLLPLIGVYLIEYSSTPVLMYDLSEWSSNQRIFPIYLFFTVVSIFIHLVTKEKIKFCSKYKIEFNYNILLGSCFIILLLSLFINLFGFGGLSVIMGKTSKTDFEGKHNYFSAVAFFIFSYLVPGLLSLVIIATKSATHKIIIYHKILIFILFLISFLIGHSWGYKTSGFTILFVPFALLMPEFDFKKTILIVSMGLLIIYFAAVKFIAFDVGGKEINILTFLLERATVGTVSVSWHIIRVWRDVGIDVNYLNFMLSAFGDKLVDAIFNISRTFPSEYSKYNYTFFVTMLAGHPGWKVASGWNVSTTPIGEGFVLGGYWGAMFFSSFVGAFYSLLIRKLNKLENSNKPLMFVCLLVFTVNTFLGWIQSGDFARVIHISIIYKTVLLYLVMFMVIKISKSKTLLSYK